MTYELAKQLKEEGWEQDEIKMRDHIGGRWIASDGIESAYQGSDDNECYAPNLSELIEACGDGAIHLWSNEHIKDKWMAQFTLDYVLKSGEGKTPEEAVAKLWLSLKSQK